MSRAEPCRNRRVLLSSRWPASGKIPSVAPADRRAMRSVERVLVALYHLRRMVNGSEYGHHVDAQENGPCQRIGKHICTGEIVHLFRQAYTRKNRVCQGVLMPGIQDSGRFLLERCWVVEMMKAIQLYPVPHSEHPASKGPKHNVHPMRVGCGNLEPWGDAPRHLFECDP